MKKSTLLLIIAFLGTTYFASAQKYTELQLRALFDSISVTHKGYDNKLQLNVTQLSLAELVSSVALENNLNVSVDPSLNQGISYNFFDVKVKDMFIFLYLNFELEYEFVGTILSVKKRVKREALVEIKPKELDITYNSANQFLSMDLKNDSLWRVAEKITRLSGRNFVIDPQIRNKQVNAFFQNRPFDEVMDMFVKSNTMGFTKDTAGYYQLFPVSENPAETVAATKGGKTGTTNRNAVNADSDNFTLTKTPEGNLNVKAIGTPLSEIVGMAAQASGVHYVQYSKLDGIATLEVNNISFQDLMNRLFNATNYSARKDGDIYVIGDSKFEGIRKTELIRLENRTIESVKAAIPKEMTSGLDVIEFVELNALIVTGSERQIGELKSFVSSIDVVVPMVQIDVMLLFSGKNYDLNSGFEAGLSSEPKKTEGTIFPGLDMTLGFNTINNILSAINGFGVVNLGQVTENFYMSLSLLESNSIIEIESTPKISTLNGHTAKLSIGETTYYQEQQLSFQPINQNAGFQQSSRVWKNLDANLSVTIKPFVSADEYVTLTITVKQEDFGGRVDPTAPPNLTNQNFESVIRVKNGEVILLGGLEKKSVNDTGKGTPVLSRIPILKWFFSSRKKVRDKSKLHIIVRPVVTY